MKNNELGQFIPMHYHFQMLSDEFRMESFKKAIKEVIKPNHNVVELGSGTGIMSFLAAKQGAKVWSVEFNPNLAFASRNFIRDNKMSSKVQIINADASNWLPPEPADVVICEMLHSALLREKQVQVIASFRNAHLKKFGTVPIMIPNATILAVQPIYQEYNFYGYNAPISLFQSPYYTSDSIHKIEPEAYKIIDYGNAEVKNYSSSINFKFTEKVRVNALRFITKSILSMNLNTGSTVDWFSQNLVLPLYQSLEIDSEQSLNVNFSYKPGESIETLNNSINFNVTELNKLTA
jgi:predicted RNA methylase